MDKEEIERRMQESSEVYLAVSDACINKEVGEVLHAISYVLAEIVADNDIPKKEFIAHFIESFDRAHAFLQLNPPPKKETK